jgi:hypothetical protein
MAQGALVENQIDDGKKLTDLLTASGFDVTAAFWVRTAEDGEWTLYIASKVVDEKGPAAAYRAVNDALPKLKNPWISISEIKVIGTSYPMTADVLDLLFRYPGPMPIRSRRPRLGGVPIDEVYIYTHVVGDVTADKRWRGISVMVFPETFQEEKVYRVEFWPHELAAMVEPGGQPKRVSAPASVLAKPGQVLHFNPPEKPLPLLAQEDYEKKALEAVAQVAEKPS